MTLNVWKYEADWSHVKSYRKGQTLTSQEHHRQHSYVTSSAEPRRQLMVLDAKRAFQHADAFTETCVKPPQLRDTERCWLLKTCMYGTLLAAAGWQHRVQKVGADIGMLCSSNCPCASGHSSRIWTWLCMVTISSSLDVVMTSIGCLRN